MKRNKLICGFLSVLLILAAAGCSGPEKPEDPESQYEQSSESSSSETGPSEDESSEQEPPESSSDDSEPDDPEPGNSEPPKSPGGSTDSRKNGGSASGPILQGLTGRYQITEIRAVQEGSAGRPVGKATALVDWKDGKLTFLSEGGSEAKPISLDYDYKSMTATTDSANGEMTTAIRFDGKGHLFYSVTSKSDGLTVLEMDGTLIR